MLNKNSLIVTLSILTTSCLGANNKVVEGVKQCANQSQAYEKYEACDLDNGDIKDLYQVYYEDEKPEIIILKLIGGPSASFSIKEQIKNPDFKKAIASSALGKVSNKKNASYYIVNQSQWLKQEKFNNAKGINEESAMKENYETIDRAHKLVKHFKNQGKKVILAGHSYGSFLVNLYLSKYGDDLPDRVVSLMGRLNAPLAAKALKENYLDKKEVPFFGANDAVISTLKLDSLLPANPTKEQIAKMDNIWYQTRIGYYLWWNDFTKTIKDEKLDKTIFVTAESDQQVGWFSSQETNFAKSKGASVRFYDQNLVLSKWNNLKNKDNFRSSKAFAHGFSEDYEELFEQDYFEGM